MIVGKRTIIILMVSLLGLTSCTSEPQQGDTQLVLEEATPTTAREAAEKQKVSLNKNQDTIIVKGELYEDFTLFEYNGFTHLINNATGEVIEISIDDLSWQVKEDFLNGVDYPTNIAIEKTTTGFLYFLDRGKYFSLHHYFDGESTLINEWLCKSLYKISSDKSRIAFLDNLNKKLYVYNVNNNNLYGFSADRLNINSIINHFDEAVTLSPKGGFITIQIREGEEIVGFKSYGTTKGTLIHDLIYGIYPRWSNNEKIIGYLYLDKNKELVKRAIQDKTVYLSSKIGLYNRIGKGSINILTELEDSNYIMGPLKWAKDDKSLIFVSGIERGINIHLMDIKRRSIISYRDNNQENTCINIHDVLKRDRYLIYTTSLNNSSYNLKVVDLEGSGIIINSQVKGFKNSRGDNADYIGFLEIKDGIMYVKNNSLYILDGTDSHIFFRNKYPIKAIEYISSLGGFVVYLEKATTEAVIIPFDV